jgi:homogentisate 1,2-dioxygenase
MDELTYLSGYGNHFATEALSGTLPKGQNSPQRVPHGLYAEQISGSAFTAPKSQNQRSWLYRIRPSVVHGEFTPFSSSLLSTEAAAFSKLPPTQLRWDPIPLEKEKSVNFINGLRTAAINGNLVQHQGASVYLYSCNKEMQRKFFMSQDGEWLIVPELGELLLRTEFGLLTVKPEEIAVIPRGVKFQVNPLSEFARGYVCENHGLPFRLPERGPVGANGLANERDFLYPTACYEDIEKEFILISKYLGKFWECSIKHSPLDVVAWHGNYAPYKYDLNNFNAINSVSFDHVDPSIFTVLTSQSALIGTANIDFVIFPERWQVAEHTFRPPYYHRNIMSELMGLVKGEYDAKKAHGFQPGGLSIHNCMTPHGPDRVSFENASKVNLKPDYIENSLAFMFESQFPWLPTEYAMTSKLLQSNYRDCWQDLPKNFK